ncbi:hypothetical protein V8E36_001708 [Tilletia maclaganii]
MRVGVLPKLTIYALCCLPQSPSLPASTGGNLLDLASSTAGSLNVGTGRPAPVTVADDQAREAMGQGCRLFKLAGHVSAATVEWLSSPPIPRTSPCSSSTPCLQVEHSTNTEMVSGVHSHPCAAAIGDGQLSTPPRSNPRHPRALWDAPSRGPSSSISTLSTPASHRKQRKPQPKAHVVACRIPAENLPL